MTKPITFGANLKKEIQKSSGDIGCLGIKTYAGLRDAWLYGNNEEALPMFLDYSDWGIELIPHLDDKQMEASTTIFSLPNIRAMEDMSISHRHTTRYILLLKRKDNSNLRNYTGENGR